MVVTWSSMVVTCRENNKYHWPVQNRQSPRQNKYLTSNGSFTRIVNSPPPPIGHCLYSDIRLITTSTSHMRIIIIIRDPYWSFIYPNDQDLKEIVFFVCIIVALNQTLSYFFLHRLPHIPTHPHIPMQLPHSYAPPPPTHTSLRTLYIQFAAPPPIDIFVGHGHDLKFALMVAVSNCGVSSFCRPEPADDKMWRNRWYKQFYSTCILLSKFDPLYNVLNRLDTVELMI